MGENRLNGGRRNSPAVVVVRSRGNRASAEEFEANTVVAESSRLVDGGRRIWFGKVDVGLGFSVISG